MELDSGSSPTFRLLPDEQLIALAIAENNRLASEVLLLRYRDRMNREVARLTRGNRLHEPECQDAFQDSVVWFEEAMQRFNLDRAGRGEKCSFPRLLNLVLSGRFHDWLRRHYQDKRVQGCSLQALAQDVEGNTARCHVEGSGKDDPSDLASANELQACVRAILDQSDKTTRKLIQGKKAGEPLTEIALQLNLNYDKTKRLWQKIVKDLEKRLGWAVE